MTGTKVSLSRHTRGRLVWVSIFAVAMAYLEAAVVVYLRLIFYPEGFDFPLAAGPSGTILIELGREIATILMLVAAAILCGRNKMQWFAYFSYAFGIWDITYYVWLKLEIGWPPSLFTRDLLFLIPLPWVGPVLAPMLVSIALIAAGVWIIKREDMGVSLTFPRWAWWVEVGAGLVIILSFLWDAPNVVAGGYPGSFRWDIFGIGLLGGSVLFYRMMSIPANKSPRSIR